MRDGVCVEIKNAVANDTQSAAMREALTKKDTPIRIKNRIEAQRLRVRFGIGAATECESSDFYKKVAANDMPSAATCQSHMKKIFSAFRRRELRSRNPQKVGSDSEPS